MPILVLTTNPANPKLEAELVRAIHAQIGGSVNWLHQSIAVEFKEPKAPQALQIARQVIGDEKVDANLVPDQKRRKKLLIADMDSTMINEECIDELGAALGIKDQIAQITERAMRGELDFEQALDERVLLLKGLDLDAIKEVRRERITYAPGGRVLVQTMKAYGAYTALVSGGFTLFADYFGKRIGFDESTANILEFDGDVLTGTVARPIVDKDTKLAKLRSISAGRELKLEDTMAVGDGANDLMMIKAAGMGVAIHAKPVVAEQAQYQFIHSDLSALLYLQGFEEAELIRQ
ncbi:phosphoserine phosphatase SerB [Maritalea sp.]|uniref:phosphoserine phosphatase SerB n=1 Tax=Maritalea sp. TaxID=2003361 RepID=UPI003EF42B3A